MSRRVQTEALSVEAKALDEADSAALLRALVEGPVKRQLTSAPESSVVGVVIGELLAITDDGNTPLVIFPDQPATALRARTLVDLQGTHIGKSVALMFESGNPQRPIVIGVLRGSAGWHLSEQSGQVKIDADGERMVISAKEQLVLRCGKASITLTKAGKVLIQGAYVSTRSTGVNRIKGASVQIN